MTKRFLTLLQFARKFRFHLNRDEPASFGGGIHYLAKRSELHREIVKLVGLGFDPDTVLSRLARGTRYPERVILVLNPRVPETFSIPTAR
jgi:hypothetical protein